MTHRHLLPDEIDLLVDDEVGFGMAPLREHAESCPECRRAVEDARLLGSLLEDLPHLSPSHDFASRVMSEVPVFVPWHVAARDSIAQLVPTSRSARLAVAGLAGTAAGVVTLAMLWVMTHGELLVAASGAASGQLRQVFVAALSDLAAAVLGPSAGVALAGAGNFGLAVAAAGFLAASAAALFGLRALAVAAGRRRS